MRFRLLLMSGALGLAMPVVAQDAAWQADAVSRAVAYHAANLPALCAEPDRSAMEPASFELQIGEDTAARQALLIEFPCQISAYSQTAVYLMSDQHGTVTEVLFPAPVVQTTYQGKGSETVDEIVITETRSVREVVNPHYDNPSRIMSERNQWRELGDAFTETRWGYKDGRFQIMYFAVDASFDGNENPIILIEEDLW